MPYDRNHVKLSEGDRVLVECVVARLQEDQEDVCNLTLHTVFKMPRHTRPSAIALNSQQVLVDPNPVDPLTGEAALGGLGVGAEVD